jgi:DNA-binding NarL/FixJ family response regulator
MKKIKIILADDHQLFRDGIKSLLNLENFIDIIDEVSDGEELLKILNHHIPDIIICDISMPKKNGIEITKILKKKYPQIKILILSMYINKEFIIDAIEAGAQGYLPKDTSRDELLKAIKTIYDGQDYFNKDVAQIALNNFIKKSNIHTENHTNSEKKLTPREIEIVKLVAEGLLNKEIADKLNISPRTVDNHKAHILQKLNLKSSIDIVKYAIKNELIKL